MISVRPLTDPEQLEVLLASQPLQPFLQSWAWGEFQASFGRRLWRLGAYEGAQLVGAALVMEHEILLGKTYLYCPRGPIAATPAAWQEMLAAIRDTANIAGAMYCKVDPGLTVFPLDTSTISADYEPGTTLQPRQTLILDLNQSAETLLSAMHQKTRYNIRLAEKRGVTVHWSNQPEDFEIFLRLMTATYRRQGIRLHAPEYYRQMFNTLGPAGMAELAMAEYQGMPIAANLIIWHGQTATYLHGGSADEHKDLMAPHLVQWRTIERAKSRGATKYDFWGVAPADQPDHKWAGITRFKKGFGGQVVAFPSSLNSVIQPSWYWAYRLAKRVRGGVDE